MAIIPPALSPISRKLDNMLPDRYLVLIQENLIRSGMYVKASDLITLVLISGIVLGTVALLLFMLLGINPILGFLIGFFTPLGIIFGWIFFLMEKRVDAIEQTTPDFLRQIASLLRAGVGIETAMEDISKHGSGPLNDELKRAVIEIKIGSSFEEALISMGERLKSKNLDRTFRMILEGKRVGGSLSDVIETVAEDLRAVLALKRERKANVMMSVMFLLIAAIIAAPFALGMIMTYSAFIEALGKTNPLLDASVTAASGYIIIHSTIASILIGIVLYGSAKKGVKFVPPLVIVSYGIFYVIKVLGPSLLGFT
ncbi:type II secretion system F family protein [Methanobacterium paludis]|uniref:Type II secretion system F domain protein n=1 Tax=Methanobacterium paludis (strain DSM 25820 / JCM 18151 / SWAN1) TaxID=868131 RepID=F6D6D5_METPW|nr:type II secretion system F family protein [Methanobacterium paludis]AEG18956.1 Type II secretion system F domain protein [Methanobacterium paludis]